MSTSASYNPPISGEAQEALDEKVDKLDLPGRVYVTDGNGDDTSLAFDFSGVAFTIPVRDAEGQMKAVAGTDADDVVVKSQLDTKADATATSTALTLNESLASAAVLPLTSGLFYHPEYVGGNGIPAEGLLQGLDFVAGRTCTLTDFSVNVGIAGSAGAVVRIGVYSIVPSTGVATLVADLGTVGCTTTGTKSVSGSAPVVKGTRYVTTATVQGAAGTRPSFNLGTLHNPWVGMAAAVGNAVSLYAAGAGTVSGALPSTATFAGNSSSNVAVWVKAAA